MRWALAAGYALLAMLLARAAFAAPPPTARLVYESTLEGGACADAQDVHRAVALRLGRDPFADDAPRTVTIRLERRGAGIGAFIALHGADGALLGTRDLSSNDCAELIAALAFAVSLAIDPVTATRPAVSLPAVPAAIPPPPSQPAPSQETPTLADAGHGSRADVGTAISNAPVPWMALGMLGSASAAPAPSVGVDGAIGLRWRRASLALEMRGDFAASAPLARGGRASTSLLLFSAVPCAYWGDFAGCGVVGAGALDGAATGVVNPSSDRSACVVAGVRLSFDRVVFGPLGLGVHADLLAPLVRTTLYVGGEEAWTTPPVSASLGLRALGTFR